MNNGSATGVSSLLGLPAAPSPHSCCDWNSQCPINSQWFINGLCGSFRQNRKCEMRQVDGKRHNGARYMCILFMCFCPSRKCTNGRQIPVKVTWGPLEVVFVEEETFLYLSYSETYGCELQNLSDRFADRWCANFHRAFFFLFYLSWSGISYNALEVIKQVAEWRIFRLAALLLSRSWNHKSHLEPLQSCWHVCIIFSWSCSSKVRSFLSKFTRPLHSLGPLRLLRLVAERRFICINTDFLPARGKRDDCCFLSFCSPRTCLESPFHLIFFSSRKSL